MELNQTTLRGILASILSVNEKYVVPKQGNWFNPQENQSNIDNWCAYRIKSNRPRTTPFYHEEQELGGKTNYAVVEKIAEIELQFVGPKSEELANSVAMWPMRSDVQAQFQNVQGAVMYDDYTAISSNFTQDANNSIAWNVTFKVLWYSVQATGQGPMPNVDIQGRIK